MKRYQSLLTRCSVFSGIEPDSLIPMLSCLSAQVLSFKKGESILRQGDPAYCFGVLLSGSAQIIAGDIRGDHAIIAQVRQTEMFAESFACAALPSLPVSVVALENCLVLLLDSRRATAACSRGCMAHSRLVTALLRGVCQKNLMLNEKLQIVMQRTTREKLLAYLSARKNQVGSSHFSIPFDRQGLADYLGVERSAMSSQLGRLKKEGLIDFRKNQFTLLDSGAPSPDRMVP